MRIEGFRLSAQSSQQADQDSWGIWQANQMDAESQIAMTESLIKGVSYLSVWPGDTYPTIAVEDALQTIVAYQPGSGFRVRAAGLKVWVDEWTGDFRANDWLQSDAPPIVKLAADAVGDAKTPREQMQRLETFVRGYITNKNLSVGYASALEVAKNPEGDCTEHAVLLAALGRARGIATRVVDGLAYVDSYAGNRYVFVPHAWAQAYVDGHWQSFDAALPGFDAGHIALSVGGSTTVCGTSSLARR